MVLQVLTDETLPHALPQLVTFPAPLREALLFWKKMAKKILNQFLTCHSTYRMLRDSLGAPIAFIRRILHGAGKKVEQFLLPSLKSQEAITVIFADESTMVSRVFGRTFITKNHAENQFKVKDWLKVHKSVKNNTVGSINFVLFGYFYFRTLTLRKKEEVVQRLL
ncbi:MAG: hypothetical protein ACTSRS_19460 [Candidatus Helarchaeota archaeon]